MRIINCYFLLILSIPLFSQQGSEQGNIIFKGKLSGPTEGHKIYLYNNVTRENDSSEIVNGEFSIIRKFTRPTRYLFYTTYDLRVNRGYVPFGILVGAPCAIVIEGNIADGMPRTKVTGSAQHALYDSFSKNQAMIFIQLREELAKRFGKAFVKKPDEKDPQYPVFEKTESDLLKKLLAPLFEKFITGNPAEYTSLFLLDRNASSLEIDLVETLYANLSPSLKALTEGKHLEAYITGENKTGIGKRVSNFTLMTPEGKPFSFSSLQGKYVLLDFWASWCGPCKEEFPNLKSLYTTYEGKNFEILGISIDRDSNAWKKAILKENLSWPQVTDYEGEQGIALKDFAVTSIPRTFLIDPKGYIIAKNLRGNELSKKLYNLFQ